MTAQSAEGPWLDMSRYPDTDPDTVLTSDEHDLLSSSLAVDDGVLSDTVWEHMLAVATGDGSDGADDGSDDTDAGGVDDADPLAVDDGYAWSSDPALDHTVGGGPAHDPALDPPADPTDGPALDPAGGHYDGGDGGWDGGSG